MRALALKAPNMQRYGGCWGGGVRWGPIETGGEVRASRVPGVMTFVVKSLHGEVLSNFPLHGLCSNTEPSSKGRITCQAVHRISERLFLTTVTPTNKEQVF